MQLNQITDRELCGRVHDQGNTTDFENELMTRLIERNTGAKEIEELVVEVNLEGAEKMIPVRRAMITTAIFLLLQGFFLTYFMPCS